MPKLQEISADYIGMLNEDMDAEQLKDCLDNIEEAFNDKATNVLSVVNSMDSDVSAIDAEIKRLQARKKAMVNRKDSLKEYLRTNMEATGITKIQHPLFNVTLAKPSVKCEVTDVDALPDEFVKVELVTKPDLNKIKRAIKDGEDVNGAQLVEGQSRILIK